MKTITSKMAKFTDKSDYYTKTIIDNVNSGSFDNWDFNPAVVLNAEYLDSLKSVIYSVLKSENQYSAKSSISRIATIFGTCPQYAERMIRGIEKVQIQNQYGLDCIIIE